MRILLLFLVLFGCSYKDKVKKSKALYLNIGGEPSVINPITSTDAYSRQLHGYIFESLLTRNDTTYEWEPKLAHKWEISKDNQEFTFFLRKDVKWHDGKLLTAHDIKFSFDIFFDDQFKTASKRPYVEGIKEAVVLDDHTIKFVAKNSYYGNFDVVAGGIITAYPKHFYGNPDNKKLFNKKLIGTGPFKFTDYQRGKYFVLSKNNEWWGNTIESMKDQFRYERVILRFISNSTVSLEMLKKHRLDFIGMQPDVFVKKTSGPIWGKDVFKVRTNNKDPKGYNFIGWNLKHPILKSKNVRKALFHIANRKLMIEKFEYNMSVLARAPNYPSSPYSDYENLPEIKFDPTKALKMLRSEGWSDTDNDGILDKVINGQKTPFSITIIEPYQGFVKYLTIIKEDARKIGIDIDIKFLEWSSFIKLLDEKKFDAFRMAWGGVIDWDPKQIWHTESINGGSNFISYSNPEVDKLIDKARLIQDRDERIKVLRQVERQIVDDSPYLWFTFKEDTLYGHSSRIYKEVETYPYDIGISKWQLKSNMKKVE